MCALTIDTKELVASKVTYAHIIDYPNKINPIILL